MGLFNKFKKGEKIDDSFTIDEELSLDELEKVTAGVPTNVEQFLTNKDYDFIKANAQSEAQMKQMMRDLGMKRYLEFLQNQKNNEISR